MICIAGSKIVILFSSKWRRMRRFHCEVLANITAAIKTRS